MSLILCGENCRHQKEGYCALDMVTPLTSDASSACGYYEPAGKEALAKEREGLGHTGDRD